MARKASELEGWQVIITDENGSIVTEKRRRPRRGGNVERVFLQRTSDAISFTRGDSIILKDEVTQTYSVYLVNEIRLNTLNHPVEILAFSYLRWFELKPTIYYEQLDSKNYDPEKPMEFYKTKFLEEVDQNEIYLTAEVKEVWLQDFIGVANVTSDLNWKKNSRKEENVDFYARFICDPAAEHYYRINFQDERRKLVKFDPKTSDDYLKKISVSKTLRSKIPSQHQITRGKNDVSSEILMTDLSNEPVSEDEGDLSHDNTEINTKNITTGNKPRSEINSKSENYSNAEAKNDKNDSHPNKTAKTKPTLPLIFNTSKIGISPRSSPKRINEKIEQEIVDLTLSRNKNEAQEDTEGIPTSVKEITAKLGTKTIEVDRLQRDEDTAPIYSTKDHFVDASEKQNKNNIADEKKEIEELSPTSRRKRISDELEASKHKIMKPEPKTTNLKSQITGDLEEESSRKESNLNKYLHLSNKVNFFDESNGNIEKFSEVAASGTTSSDLDVSALELALKNTKKESIDQNTESAIITNGQLSEVYMQKLRKSENTVACRFKEFSKIFSTLFNTLKTQGSSVIKILGKANTGKSHTVASVLKELKSPAIRQELPTFRVLEASCSPKTGKAEFYSYLWAQLSGYEEPDNDIAKSSLEIFFREVPQGRKQNTIIIVEDINFRNHSDILIFKELLKWCMFKSSKLIVIFLSNEENPHKINWNKPLPNDVRIHEIVFDEFLRSDLFKIAKLRLEGVRNSKFYFDKDKNELIEVTNMSSEEKLKQLGSPTFIVNFDSDAIELGATLISEVSIDICMALLICKESILIAHRKKAYSRDNIIHVNFKHIQDAVTNFNLGEKLLQIVQLPSIYKLVLLAIQNLSREEDSNANGLVEFEKIQEEMCDLLNKMRNEKYIFNLYQPLFMYSNSKNERLTVDSLAIISWPYIFRKLQDIGIIETKNTFLLNQSMFRLLCHDAVDQGIELWKKGNEH
ncbi:hypothetical protein Kpol_520p35 [Vanderwaltozyma polyspora DSM 70294]|uniref:BAH domain-containing protein n=1 Tax=Vanderwaltozyma polyspora (strain ATCC 22028 / DSM 70294 / BCRC 21397 / CBS 2163 / NBRC 10782 / NRRL Y-8283 / UCD 57-17) TaxID=436907 RepID=A7TMB8_VANPO|nr:uncharacterized protein Kpol_520p35 [Vanderwaltozyma polyspora DSM 70294]EDO16612.1 hypothetical protein Kpol_520p35 [Vanderwaltozyma polyspora DSM 70294]